MPDDLVAAAIARQEALERVSKAAQRRELAEADYRAARHKIDLKLGEVIKGAFKVGATAPQISRACNLSLPRVYQLRNLYRDHIAQEFAHD